MVTPFQAVSTTVPKSVVVAPHRTRSPTLRSRDCSPVIETPSNDEGTCNVARPGDSRRIHVHRESSRQLSADFGFQGFDPRPECYDLRLVCIEQFVNIHRNRVRLALDGSLALVAD